LDRGHSNLVEIGMLPTQKIRMIVYPDLTNGSSVHCFVLNIEMRI